MSRRVLWVGIPLLMALHTVSAGAQALPAAAGARELKVILLGTAGGPTINPQRFGISTLIVAGIREIALRCRPQVADGARAAGHQSGRRDESVPDPSSFQSCLALPELYLAPWASQGRQVPLQVWGPQGTESMMKHLQAAFAFDIHVRRDLNEKFPANGIKVVAHDIREGVVYDANGVTVTAFLVDHGLVKPAFGYRIDYQGRSLIISGDTKLESENLIKHSQGVNLLIHELGRWKDDPLMSGAPDEAAAQFPPDPRPGQNDRRAPHRRRRSGPGVRAGQAEAGSFFTLQRRTRGHAAARETELQRPGGIRGRFDDHRHWRGCHSAPVRYRPLDKGRSQ